MNNLVFDTKILLKINKVFKNLNKVIKMSIKVKWNKHKMDSDSLV